MRAKTVSLRTEKILCETGAPYLTLPYPSNFLIYLCIELFPSPSFPFCSFPFRIYIPVPTIFSISLIPSLTFNLLFCGSLIIFGARQKPSLSCLAAYSAHFSFYTKSSKSQWSGLLSFYIPAYPLGKLL